MIDKEVTNRMTVEQKEQALLGTLLYCNNVIHELKENSTFNKITKVKKLFENCDAYKFNFLNLVSLSTGEGIVMLRENHDTFMENNTVIKMNERQNVYAYLREVKSFLNGFELGVQKSLNESLDIHVPVKQKLGGGKLIENPFNDGKVTMNNYTANKTPLSDIDGFKRELDLYITELEKINDTNNYSDDILKIKMLARKSLFVYGFNIMNSLVFQTTLSHKYGLNNIDLLAILFNRIDNSLLFVYRKNIIIRYTIKNDGFEMIQIASKYDDTNYMTAINQSITFKLLILYQDLSGLHYVNNVYGDEMINKNIDRFKNLIVKR